MTRNKLDEARPGGLQDRRASPRMRKQPPALTERPRPTLPDAPISQSALQQELRQTVPFASPRAEAFLNLLRTADRLQRQLRVALRPYGVTDTQYNALRILRGARGAPMSCAEIGERLINQDPDITRLLDRLERQGLVRRERDLRDRRIVLSRITPAGLSKLQAMDKIVDACVEGMLAHMDTEEIHTMIALLVRARRPEQGDHP